ncbi:hypothetical protein SeMB42_g00870 [Synchytrium endobioticum]|uniref:Guanylate-binding protein N-terminal domain-containing protein n=1 Tax=Synchytrium endobioticum TaxID=286115 RepID=A0A507DNJ6_9FUNG|nr:hypothetical protein SeLEV6574_g00127 [Synchytrium endobioticum]TPX53289.1 hypothetical protein SeMB42_g00870 [Synchytrium endobioticum]
MEFLRRRRLPPMQPWETLPQPVPLVKINAQPTPTGIKYVATGITSEAEQILIQLEGPLYVAAFIGFGRSGKSFTATKLRSALTGDNNFQFMSRSGNVPCTHGIDLMVFPHPTKPGQIIFLDCEGSQNHNQSALPFVMGLAARLSSRLYVFERGCFTTGGLETVMQVLTMGLATRDVLIAADAPNMDLPRSLVLVENMSMNQGMDKVELLTDLLNETHGDEATNRIRRVVRERFDIEFAKLPFCMRNPITSEHQEAVADLVEVLSDRLTPLIIGNVPIDGPVMIQLAAELVSQIREGGSKFNMVSATEALVANMASEAANAAWSEFVERCRQVGNHPSQVSGRKHIASIMNEVHTIAAEAQDELEAFVSKLEPSEPASVGKQLWKRNLKHFEEDLKNAHAKRVQEIAKYTRWMDRIYTIVSEVVRRVFEITFQLFKVARFTTSLIITSNYYMAKESLRLLTNVVRSILSPSQPQLLTQ